MGISGPICCDTAKGAGVHGIPRDDRIPWNRQRSGEPEAREFGWYTRTIEGHHRRCGPDDVGAEPDANRVLWGGEAVWDREEKRFMRKPGADQGGAGDPVDGGPENQENRHG
jgi:hypothetical protein